MHLTTGIFCHCQDIVTWKGELYFVDEPSADPAQLNDSFIAFSKNGQMQGIAYRYANMLAQGQHSSAHDAV